MFEDEEMGSYHPEIENGSRNGDNETGIIGALGNKLEKTFKNSLSAMKSDHEEKVHSDAAVTDEEVSIQGKILANLMGHITNDLAIGKKIKSGELRKRMKEPSWLVPDCFVTEDIDMEGFTMKLLSSKENPNTERVILQLHGGGYMGAVRNAYYVFAGLYNEVSEGCSVLTPDYRVAPEHPYPAALEDAVACYKWLLSQGWFGSQIVLAGDSAGGGLAMCLTMYLRDHDMPLPAGIVAMSPWTDLTAGGESYETNYEKDHCLETQGTVSST